MELCFTIGESRLLLGVCAEGTTVDRVGLSSGGMWFVIFSLGISFLSNSSFLDHGRVYMGFEWLLAQLYT